MKAFRALAISALLIAQTITSSPALALDSSPVGRPISPFKTASGAGVISIAWSAPIQNTEAVDGYKIQYRKITDSDWTTFTNKEVGTAIDVTGLESPGTYAMRVAAVNGSFISPYVTVKSDPSQKVATQISTGGYSACAVLDDATAECWGYNFAGSLGDNVHTTTADTDVPYPVKPFNLTNVVEIDAGSTNNCALKANGTVWCWGTNTFGELGDGTNYYSKKPAIVPGITEAVDIDVTYSTACAVIADGSVKCWGLNLGKIFGDNSTNNLSPRTIPGFSNVQKFIIGRTFSCALLQNSDLKCAGDNSVGQLGVGYVSPSNNSHIDAIIASDVKEFSVGGTNACYLNLNNEYYCWGSNNYGQVGDDTGRPVTSPKLILSGVKTVSENIGYHQCVAMLDQTVKCWGYNPYDALGVNDNIQHDAPITSTEVPTDTYSKISSGYYFNCSLSETNGAVACWGSNDHGQIGNGADGSQGSKSNFSLVNGYAEQYLQTADRPDDIDWISQSGKARDSINIGWRAPNDNFSPITQYNVRYTFDDIQKVDEADVNWIEGTSDIPQFLIPGVSEARAAYITVNAQNEVGTSGWTSPIVVTTSGTREITGLINSWDNFPVYGGSISWSTQDGSFSSSKPIGLTAYGTIKFPRVPAGNLRMVFTGIHTPDGGLVSGAADIYLGFNQTTINLPQPASGPIWAIQVTAPDGPVPNANVSITGLSSQSRVDGFTFEVSEIMNSGITNGDGVYYAYGYADSPPQVNVRYDDGILVQQKSATMFTNFTTVELEEMPWINVYQEMLDAYKNQVVSLTFDVNEAAPLAIRHNLAPLTSSGILITVKPPKGATQKNCGAKLSGRTNANGTVTLKVCATKSGKYKVLGTGAIASESVNINVSGSTPLAVNNLQAISPELETAEITWDKPSYLGGKKLKYYQITIVGNGKSKSFTTKNLSYTVTGLANATTYEVTIKAVTSIGSGNIAKTTVPIA
jgi:alpha-tubulin suppressor-like RCC1 family protein